MAAGAQKSFTDYPNQETKSPQHSPVLLILATWVLAQPPMAEKLVDQLSSPKSYHKEQEETRTRQ